MHSPKKILHVLLHERHKIHLMFLPYYQKYLSDKTFVKLLYKWNMHKKLDLKNPKTFNEKLNWLKLYDHNPLYTNLVDKYAVKPWVADKIGEQYIIPTLGVWDSFDEIDFDSLPNQFVLKTTHGGGSIGVVICRDKTIFDYNVAKEKLNRSMNISGYDVSREWPYLNVPRRIIAEEFMEDTKTKELRDYKFFCMDGIVRALFIATERQKAGDDVKFDFFDADFKHLDLYQRHPMSGQEIAKPETFEEMKLLSAKLSEEIPQVRVDFYEINGKTYFGEMTFFHHAGIVPFHPESWDEKFGEWITLPTEKLI